MFHDSRHFCHDIAIYGADLILLSPLTKLNRVVSLLSIKAFEWPSTSESFSSTQASRTAAFIVADDEESMFPDGSALINAAALQNKYSFVCSSHLFCNKSGVLFWHVFVAGKDSLDLTHWKFEIRTIKWNNFIQLFECRSCLKSFVHKYWSIVLSN